MRSLDDILSGGGDNLTGEKVKIADFFGRPITILGAKVLASKEEEGKFYTLLGFRHDGADYITTTSSGVIRQQVEEFQTLTPSPFPIEGVTVQEFPSKKAGRKPWQKIVRAGTAPVQPPDDDDIPF